MEKGNRRKIVNVKRKGVNERKEELHSETGGKKLKERRRESKGTPGENRDR